MQRVPAALTGPALTLNGRLAMYLLSAHSLCTRKRARANDPTSSPSPGTIALARSTQALSPMPSGRTAVTVARSNARGAAAARPATYRARART